MWDNAELQEMLDRAWEAELALFLGDLAEDLRTGAITIEQAHIRLDAIRDRKRLV